MRKSCEQWYFEFPPTITISIVVVNYCGSFKLQITGYKKFLGVRVTFELQRVGGIPGGGSENRLISFTRSPSAPTDQASRYYFGKQEPLPCAQGELAGDGSGRDVARAQGAGLVRYPVSIADKSHFNQVRAMGSG